MDTSSIAATDDHGATRRAIVEVCRRLYGAGLIAGQDGNVSVRRGNVILVTPSGISKVDVRESDLVELALDGGATPHASRASSEVLMHLRIYRHRPDVNAVVHAHPPVATGFGVAGLDFMDDILPETIFQLGGVPLIPYATPGTSDLGDALVPYLAKHDGYLLANHGATTVGPTLLLAHQRMESLEHAARIVLTARMLGQVNVLAPHEADRLRAMREQGRMRQHTRSDDAGEIDEQG
jgi:L-fuculose-phosphate aldolase